VDVLQVANEFFTAREVADITMRPPGQQPLRFFELWTRKEALIKAEGESLAKALHELDTSIFDDAPGDAAPLTGGAERWSVLQFKPALGYVAAVAVGGGSAYTAKCGEIRWTSSEEALHSSPRIYWKPAELTRNAPLRGFDRVDSSKRNCARGRTR